MCDLLDPDHDEARRCIRAVTEAGIDIDSLAKELQADGASAFLSSWNEPLEAIRNRIDIVT